MSLKWKQKQILQKQYWEQQLKARLAVLAGKGIEGARVDKDPIAKKIKASIHATDNRLRQIAANEKRTEEMARIKAERAAAPAQEKEKEKEHGKGEKPKKAAGEGKEKKPKAEKKPGPPKDKAGDKGQKPAAPPEEDKAK